MTERKSVPLLRSSSRLVEHDIVFAREQLRPGVVALVSRVLCERQRCVVDVEGCENCERFVRVERHDAGYTLLCRSTEEPAG